MLGTALRRWNWLEEGVLPLATVVMDAAWAYPLFALFIRNALTGERLPGFSFWLCLLILLGGLLPGRVASQNQLGAVIVVVGGFAAVWISLLLVLPSGSGSLELWIAELGDRLMNGRPGEIIPMPLLVSLCAGFLWIRGVRISSSVQIETSGSFVVGVIALGGLLALSALLPSAQQIAVEGLDAAAEGGAGAGIGPVLFLLSLPAAIVFAFLSRFIGERALILSQGILVLGLLLLGGALPSGPGPEGLFGWVLLFMTTGLVSLSLVGVSNTIDDQEARIGVRLQIDRYWLVAMLSVVAGVMIVGLLFGQLVAPEMILRVLGWIRPLWNLIIRILFFIIAIFAYLFFSLLEPLLANLENRPRDEVARPMFSPVDSEPLPEVDRTPFQLPAFLSTLLKIALGLAVVALVAAIFILAVRRLQRSGPSERGEVLETRETILSVDLLRGQLADLLNSMRRSKVSPFLDLGPAGDPRRVVRELYQSVLAKAQQLDVPRRRGQTPRAYRRSLLYLCPEQRESLNTLTRAYVVARYGILPPSADQVRAAKEACERISEVLEAKLKQRQELQY